MPAEQTPECALRVCRLWFIDKRDSQSWVGWIICLNYCLWQFLWISDLVNKRCKKKDLDRRHGSNQLTKHSLIKSKTKDVRSAVYGAQHLTSISYYTKLYFSGVFPKRVALLTECFSDRFPFLSRWHSCSLAGFISLRHSSPADTVACSLAPHLRWPFVISAVYVTWIRNIGYNPVEDSWMGCMVVWLRTGVTTDQRNARRIFKIEVQPLAFPVKASGGMYYPPKGTHTHTHARTQCVWEGAVQLSELSMRAFDIHRREEEEKVKQQRGHCLTRDITS